ncbi:hypothetical protein FC24_GL001164 [Loigolactobacillus rennini DSM 20253]|uniref:IrrE N-terminal-like domain-containing protein n=1 Tax=Loigolactobacillus rennini DSM 20253 TaxID=1423796 RepID=A0A0R2D5M9_9LACO|nr:hypothetical protein FC24_GL001164 [Loigolactobacillus rennini DSM 20253]
MTLPEIITYLLNLALANHINIEATRALSSETPSLVIADQHKIIINLNWHNQKELPFQIAHEISHLLNHDDGVLYYTAFSFKSKIEAAANSTAIELLAEYYCDNFIVNDINPVEFMEVFGIPQNLEHQVTNKLAIIFSE